MDFQLCADAPQRSTLGGNGRISRNARRATGRALGAALLAVALLSSAAGAKADGTVARITSTQNQVETLSHAKGTWSPSTLNQELQGQDHVRTGTASRASILYADQTLQRLNEKSEIEIVAPNAGSPGLLKVISGQHYFSSRTPKDYGRIETPTVTAAI